jgi:hypothetical protein
VITYLDWMAEHPGFTMLMALFLMLFTGIFFEGLSRVVKAARRLK